MGHNANLVLLNNDKLEIYYSHWGGQKTSKILLKGLKFCERHFRELREIGNLIGDAAEGGILIDKNKKNIVYFDSELLESGGFRRKFIEYLEKNNMFYCIFVY